jgi:hypothetical protein
MRQKLIGFMMVVLLGIASTVAAMPNADEPKPDPAPAPAPAPDDKGK